MQINRSHTPPWWEAVGGFKFHLIPCWSIAFCILSWFKPLNASFHSLSAPTKFEPLSDLNDETLPRRRINLRNAGVCVKCGCNFKMNCSTCHASEDCTVPFYKASSSLHLYSTKIIHSHVCKWRLFFQVLNIQVESSPEASLPSSVLQLFHVVADTQQVLPKSTMEYV